MSRGRVNADELLAHDPLLDTVDVGDADGAPILGVEDAEVLVGNPSEQRFAEIAGRMPRLRWFHATSAGVDRFEPTLARRPGVWMTRTSGHALPMAEFVLATIFAIAKRLPEVRDAQRRHSWESGRAGEELLEIEGRSVCIVGLGSIGQEVARLVTGFGMRVTGVRRHAAPHRYAARVLPPDRLAEAIQGADHVVLACPLTEKTRGLIDARALASMGERAWLINVARGAVVEEDDLFHVLSQRLIGGAALDTMWVEPVPASSRWYGLDNVIIRPHRAASSYGARARLVAQVVDGLRRYRAGQPLSSLTAAP